MPISPLALALILGSALCFSVLDLLRKKLAGSIGPEPLLVLITIGASPVFYVWMRSQDAAGATPDYWLPGLGVVVLNIFANLLFLQAVRISPLSLTIPFLSLTPVFTTLLAIPLLGEWPGALPAVGVFLVFVGAFGLNLRGGLAAVRPATVWSAYRSEKGSVMMTMVALLWSVAAPLDKMAVQSSSPAFHGWVANTGVGVGVLLLMLGRRQLGEIGRGLRRWGLVVATIVIGFLALACFLEAIHRMPIGLAETLKRAVGSFAALVSGAIFFNEEMTGSRFAAVAVMAAGVALVLLG